MQVSAASAGYTPHSPFTAPFTIISTVKQRFCSQPLPQPFYCEVYCPLSCKKVKVGLKKDAKVSTIEFNSTSHRVVSLLADKNIRYLVNNHKPNKNEKRQIEGDGWSFLIELEDKGNIAIFNPYCVDPSQPLTFYTFSPLPSIQKPHLRLQFAPIPLPECTILKKSQREIYVSKDLKFIGTNPFFLDNHDQFTFVFDPKNPGNYAKVKTIDFVKETNQHISYWLGELSKIIESEKKIEEENTIEYNLDEVYESLGYFLNLSEQVRARLMDSNCSKLYHELFTYHPRLYSAFERLGSFLNYGNTKYSTVQLAEAGFYNRSDMLQDLVYCELPQEQISNAEELALCSEKQMRVKLFPFARMSRGLPFPNVSLETVLRSLPAQKITNSEVESHFNEGNYHLFLTKDGNLSMWSSEMMVYKMFDFDFYKDYHAVKKEMKVPVTEKELDQILESKNVTEIEALFENVVTQDANEGEKKKEKKAEEIKPDQAMLEQIIMMGYGPSTARKALLKVNNESIVAALDAIEQIQGEEKQKIKEKLNKSWDCSVCTFMNPPGVESCEVCGEVANIVDEEEKVKLQKIEEELAEEERKRKEEEEKKQKEEEEKQQKEKEEKEKQDQERKMKEEEIKNSKILSLSFLRNPECPIDPFFISLLCLAKNNKKYMKVFRVGINRAHLHKFYRIEGELLISNFNRKVYANKSLEAVNQIISESRDNIEWGCKFFEPASESNWNVVDEKTLEVDENCQRIESDGNNRFLLINGEKRINCYSISISDTLEERSFKLEESKEIEKIEDKNIVCSQKVAKDPAKNQINFSENRLNLDSRIEEVSFEVIEHLSKKSEIVVKRQETQIPSIVYAESPIMSEFIPLFIEQFEGSLFTSKYSSASILDKSSIYISNYPNVNFVFKSQDNRPMLAESVTIISNNNKVQKIFSINSGLIFTANEVSWFALAKERFKDMNREQYEKWLKVKMETNTRPAFWEPVAYFDITTQVELEISFKRVAKYIFFLPTGVNKKSNNTDEVIALKIDFFGVKGRIEEAEEQIEVIQNYKNIGNPQCLVQVEQRHSQQEEWQEMSPNQYLLKQALHANTYHHSIHEEEKLYGKIPLSVSSIFTVRFKNLNKMRRVTLKSESVKRINLLKLKQAEEVLESKSVKTFKELISVQNKIGNFQLSAIVENLNLSELLESILSGPSNLTSYENLLNKMLKIQGFEAKVLGTMSEMVVNFCEEKVQVSEVGFKSFMRTYEKLLYTDEQQGKNAICQSWKNISDFVNKIRNKNYNILRNTYKIDDLVLEPALFSKDYYRLIHPNYVEESKPTSITSQPQTPINCELYVDSLTPFNSLYYINLLTHSQVEKIEFYFPKQNLSSKFKMVLRLVELLPTEKGVVENQVYYRTFHDDTFFQLSNIAYKDTEIYKKSQINYLSIPGDILSGKTNMLKFYVDFLFVTTIKNAARYKDAPENAILLPVVYSQAQQGGQENEQFKKILSSFPSSTVHNQIQERMPPHRFAIQEKKHYYVIHEFKSKFTQEVKSQLTEVVDKITQNIIDKKIVEESVQSIKINEYQLEYKGLDFAYTFIIQLQKMFRKLPGNFSVSVEEMLSLFDTYVVYESGPIMNITSSTLHELYKRLSIGEKSAFIQGIICKYLLDSQRIKNLKLSEKYSVPKIISFLSDFNIPNGTLFKILSEAHSTFCSTILLQITIKNISKYGVGSLEYFQKGEKVKEMKIHSLIEITFDLCIWILDNIGTIKNEILTYGLDLFLLFFAEEKTEIYNKEEAAFFIQNMNLKAFWKLVFLTLKVKSEALKDKIHSIFKILIDQITPSFSKSINQMLLAIIKKEKDSLYLEINPNVSDDNRMNHLQTILEEISLTKSQIFLDIDTSKQILSLPLTPTLWSLSLNIIPRKNEILIQILKNFKDEYYISLGKQIMAFCEPLTGIKALECPHINWLDLVKQLRVEGKTIFSLFIDNLRKCNFGGKSGLTMAMIEDVKKLEITCEFARLVCESQLSEKDFDEQNIKIMMTWFFMNYTTEAGSSPATDFIKVLSGYILKIFEKVSEIPQILPVFIKASLEIRKNGEVAESLFEQKRLSSSNALSFNQRFSQCFQNVINLFCNSDELHNYFAFEIDGLKYILEKVGLAKPSTREVMSECEPLKYPDTPSFDEQLLLSEGLIVTKSEKEADSENKANPTVQLKEEEFGNNVKLVPNMNEHNVVCNSTDWTIYKKGNKTKILFMPMSGPTYNEYTLYVELNKAIEVRSIKVGFPAASYEFNDKLVASPSAVTIEGSMDLKCFEPMGEMSWINDDGYTCNGVKVFVLNLQKITCKEVDIGKSLNEMNSHVLKYLKITLKRPVISFVEGQFSPINGRVYKNLGSSLSFLSVLGDDLKKLPFRLLSSCQEISKSSALTLLGTIINESNPNTVKKIANSEEFVKVFKENFSTVKEHMKSYPAIVPNIIYVLGSNNEDLGDWLINSFLAEGHGEAQASIINQIITNSEDKIFSRLSIFLKNILEKVGRIAQDEGIESGIIYTESVSFIESFCKTLEESYDLDPSVSFTFECSFNQIEQVINIFDKKYSSPEIKTLIRFLISLVYLREPLKLSEAICEKTLELVWSNCSEAKPYFYHLMGALLVNSRSKTWLCRNDNEKTKKLVDQIKNSIQTNSLKSLNYQIYLLMIISSHESEFIKGEKIHLDLYHRLKVLIFEDYEVLELYTKVLQNVVLGDAAEEKKMAEELISDVNLLVKRKDPLLQKFYVGLLGLEKEVYVNLKGFDMSSTSNKKESMIPTKFLNKSQSKQITDKINKKIKFNLTLEVEGLLKNTQYDTLFGAINSSNFLLLVKLKLTTGKPAYIGCFSPGKSFRSEEDSYCWEDAINFEKGSFVFWISQTETKFYESTDSGQHMLSLFGGEDEMDEIIVLYDGTAKEVMRMHLHGGSEPYILGSTNTKVEMIEVYNGTLKSTVSNSNKIQALSNKAKSPFNMYRHPSIYVFPARITIEKFKSIIGIKGKCKVSGKLISDSDFLGLYSSEFPDSIIDIGVIAEDPDENMRSDEGYIPEMTIFDHYSSLGGVNEVLEIGSQSIKDWKKPERRKNFEHYMAQLKSFVHLPNFFNLFIKNQESVTFLFEVASGMPDDPNSTRNWEQEQVVSSKFIYKILSDIFKYDRSPKLREIDEYGNFIEIILEKLAEISKETVRELKEEDEQEEKESESPEKLVKKKSEQAGQKKKKKGTGYGVDNQNNSKWSANEWIEHRKNVAQQIQRVICIVVSFLDSEKPITDPRLAEILKSSCVLPLLENALRSGSLLDMSKEVDLFKNYLQILKNIAKNPALTECLLDLDKKYKPPQTDSIYKLLKDLNGIAEIFTECLKSGKDNSGNDAAAGLAIEIKKTYLLIDKAVKNIAKKKDQLTIKQLKELPVAKSYRLLLENLRFGYVSLKERSEFQHFYASTISSANPSTAKILRLSQELADLSSSLPCEHTNSIFVRCDKERIDVVKILIMGSKDTPYSNGAFMFDLYCDDSYPNNPPKMSITTTGGGKIRFNPNLYSCGKVCLSLLGTWRGQASENWDAKLSTLLQLFISTQGITMSEDVYFNEPGFDSEQGTPEGDKKNEAYSNIVRLGNVRYAMNGQIKNPPKGFEEVINKHFFIKKQQILEEVEKWIEHAEKRPAEYTGLVNDHNSSWCSELKASKGKYKELLVKEYEELKKLLEKIPEPSLEEKEEEVTFQSQKNKKKMRVKEAKIGEIDVSYDPQGASQLEIEENVMQDRWSRYIGAMGIDAVKKQAESKVLLLGLKPLGLQIAKNLTLSGLKQLSIFEDRSLTLGCEEHFYMSDSKGKKIEDCIYKVKELNPYMIVKHEKQIPNVEDFNLVVSTLSIEESLPISESCRKHKKQFIHCENQGVSGFYFADLGEQFVINDTNGEQPFEGLIKSISCEQNGVVTLLDGVKHTYEDGDYVVINKVEGMEQIEEKMEEVSEALTLFNEATNTKVGPTINGRVFKIEVINWNSFRIGDTRNFKPYIRNGMCKNIKVPKKVSFKSFKESMENFSENLDANMGMYDFEKMGDNQNIFACFKSLSEFKKKNGKLPKNWDIKDAGQFVEMTKKQLLEGKKSEEEIEKGVEFAKIFSMISEAELPTIGAYLGGLVSQEIIKALTNKYSPIKQFFTFHLNELVQPLPAEGEKIETLHIKESEAFGNLKVVIGRENFDKVEKMNTFIIGAGAIGCEILKNFAMINMGAQGMITVTDPDHIETSNLTRQFLFRQKHVKKPKSATASATLMQMNPLLKGHISARLDKVCEETEEIYSDQFFDKQTVIANALDNVKARVYVDKRCVNTLKPLFESGTLGPKGHVQVIVPNKTENYGNQADPTEENQIPHCTLKMFPQETVHCIEWSRDIFGKVFTLNPKALKKVLEAKDESAVEGQERTTVANMVEYHPMNFEDCVGEAVRKFYRYFRNNVRQLLHTYPLDMKTKDGKLFWELPKRPPKQISEIDCQNEIHQTFISSYSTLLAKIYGIPYPKNFRKPEGKKEIMVVAKGVKIPQFTPNEEESKKMQKMTAEEEKEKSKQKNVMTEGEPQFIEEEQTEPEPEVKKIELTPDVLGLKVAPEEFEKDEDENGHIDLIYSMSNLRALNYGLNECTWIEAKLKAGKIMAALSTTTSVVAAIQTLEIIKLVVGCQKWRNAFVNLAVPLVQISQALQAPKHKVGKTEFTVWDIWKFKCETLADLLKQLRETHEVEGFNISTVQGKPVFWEAMYKDKEESREKLLNRPLKQMFADEVIDLNILMRDLSEEKKPYESVPRVRVQII